MIADRFTDEQAADALLDQFKHAVRGGKGGGEGDKSNYEGAIGAVTPDQHWVRTH